MAPSIYYMNGSRLQREREREDKSYKQCRTHRQIRRPSWILREGGLGGLVTCTSCRAVIRALLSVVAIPTVLAQLARVSRVTDTPSVPQTGALAFTAAQASAHSPRTGETLCHAGNHTHTHTFITFIITICAEIENFD